MKTAILVAAAVVLGACVPSTGSGGGVEGEGEGEAGLNNPALFDGLTVELHRVGPGDVDLAVVVGGAAAVEPVVAEVIFGSVPMPVDLVDRLGIKLNAIGDDTPGQARVVFVDIDGHTSGLFEALLQDRPELDVGAACDDDEITDICDLGLGCKGTPAVCAEAKAPVLVDAAYLSGADGPHLLLRGTDDDDDIAFVDLVFYDAAGNPTRVDLDGDDIPEADGAEVIANRVSHDGHFLIDSAMGLGFEDSVVGLDVVVRDRNGLLSEPRRLVFGPAPVRGAGAECDPDGFNVCGGETLCAPVGTRHLCRQLAAARAEVCGELAPIAVGDDAVRVSGSIEGVSVFDTPDGCASGAERPRPEAVFSFDVTAPLAHLTFSTDVDGTGCDTVVSVFNTCGAAVPLACGDDTGSSLASTVVLDDVAVGTYVVVVESWDEAGGSFGLSVTPE